MLNVDKFFIAALQRSDEVTGKVVDRIFDPARPEKDEQDDKVPYLIVTYDSGSATGGDKDSILAPLDMATVSVLAVSDSRQGLSELADAVWDAIAAAFEDDSIYDEQDWRFEIDDCTPSAGAVMMDETKPCYYQTLTYQCNTKEREQYEQTNN